MRLEPFTADWYSVKVVRRLPEPEAAARPNARICRQTRQSINDCLRIDAVGCSGKLDEVDGLARIYTLDAPPSYDGRYKDAAGDIRRRNPHRTSFWEVANPAWKAFGQLSAVAMPAAQ